MPVLHRLTRCSCLLAAILIIGTTSQAQDIKPWNRLYVTNELSNTVSVVDLDQSRVMATIPVGVGPTGMAITPDQEYIYVANIRSGSLSVVSTASNSVEATIPLPSWYGTASPFGIAMSPDGQQLFVSNLSDGTVRVISTKTNTVVGTITESYDWAMRYIAISPSGEYLYVAGGGDGKLTVIRLADYKAVAKVTGLWGCRHLVVSPDGSRVYVTSENTSRVYVIDAARAELIKTIQFPPGVGTTTVDISPTGKLAIVSNAFGNVSLIDTDPASQTYHEIIGQVPPSSFYQYCVVLGAEGKFAYLSNQSDRGLSPNSINVIDIAQDSKTRNTIINSIPVGQKPWGVMPVRQRLPDPTLANP
ncbi:MAG: beta-propeller fold lactonase family protein [Blastocatellia bacterium]